MIGESNLPNFKFKKHTKTPLHLRGVCCKKGIDELIDKLVLLKEAETTRDLSLQKVDPNTSELQDLNKKKHDFSFIIREKNKQKEKHEIVFSADSTPVIKYKHKEIPSQIMVMNNFRKEIINNIKRKRPNLKLESLEKEQSAYIQQNFSHFQLFTQKSKEKKELTSRNSLNNALYSIRALSSSSKNKVYLKLKNQIPSGTRFHIKN